MRLRVNNSKRKVSGTRAVFSGSEIKEFGRDFISIVVVDESTEDHGYSKRTNEVWCICRASRIMITLCYSRLQRSL